jgi:hypothetical protein
MPAVGATRHRRVMKYLLRVGLIAVFLVGGFVLRDRLGGSPAELKVGDCFDVPTTVGENVNDVQHHPCTESHTGEIILIADHPAAKGAAEPTDDELTNYLFSACGVALTSYVGPDTAKFDLGAFYPTSEDWKDGDRGITCYLTMLDESAMTASFKSN